MTSQSPEEVVRAIFAVTDAMETEGKLPVLTDDIKLIFGSTDPVEGKEAFRKVSDELNESLKGLRHQIDNLWVHEENGEDVVLCEMIVHYKRLDDSEISLPCFNTFRLRDGLISHYQIYMDIAPVFA